MSSKIEQMIDEIEEYIEGCRYQPLSNSKILVNKEELLDLLAELRRRAPDEIRRYQKIISNKEAILADAKTKAEAIINQAEVQTTALVSEHQIMQQAYNQANEVVSFASNQAQDIVDAASNDAYDIRMNAIYYTDDVLKSLEDIIGNALETTKARTENLLNSLQGCYEMVSVNRAELNATQKAEEQQAPAEEGAAEDAGEEMQPEEGAEGQE